ncbi:MAG: CAP domain-containing protein [Oscillospiraceae bacterium]|nr:CAP domain-containing protein [Oscillospiraceae bacterium]
MTWTSSNPSVARVEVGTDSTRVVVRPLSPGTAIITATTVNGISESQTVTVITNPMHAPFNYTTSQITLPNRRQTAEERAAWIAEYNAMGGASAFELETIRLINELRVSRGLNALRICPLLMMASRHYAQQKSNLNTPVGHNHGPYGGSRATAESFGTSIRWSGGNSAGGTWTPQDLFNLWYNSYGHRRFMLAPEHNYIGLGSQLGGRLGISHYTLMRP